MDGTCIAGLMKTEMNTNEEMESQISEGVSEKPETVADKPKTGYAGRKTAKTGIRKGKPADKTFRQGKKKTAVADSPDDVFNYVTSDSFDQENSVQAEKEALKQKM